mmetsp:Transcript_38024/g.80952  ORF Transcript_38024/g.80952 Transcript_38024/m.80952 type:complete len:200 (+) Transcript_38024:556-1155(+)
MAAPTWSRRLCTPQYPTATSASARVANSHSQRRVASPSRPSSTPPTPWAVLSTWAPQSTTTPRPSTRVAVGSSSACSTPVRTTSPRTRSADQGPPTATLPPGPHDRLLLGNLQAHDLIRRALLTAPRASHAPNLSARDKYLMDDGPLRPQRLSSAYGRAAVRLLAPSCASSVLACFHAVSFTLSCTGQCVGARALGRCE